MQQIITILSSCFFRPFIKVLINEFNSSNNLFLSSKLSIIAFAKAILKWLRSKTIFKSCHKDLASENSFCVQNFRKPRLKTISIHLCKEAYSSNSTKLHQLHLRCSKIWASPELHYSLFWNKRLFELSIHISKHLNCAASQGPELLQTLSDNFLV